MRQPTAPEIAAQEYLRRAQRIVDAANANLNELSVSDRIALAQANATVAVAIAQLFVNNEM